MSEGTDSVVTGHPVAAFATRLRGRLDDLVDTPTWSMTKDDKTQTLRDLAVASAQLDALRLRVLVKAERDGDVLEPGDRTVADWVARETRQTRAAARADLTHALALDEHHRVLAGAHARGDGNTAQARAITRSLDLLPRTGRFATTVEEREAAEAHLVDLAADFDAKALEQLGRRIYAVISPEAADAYEDTLLEAEEARAARKVLLEMREDPQGICHGRFRIRKLHGHMLKKALQALTNPARVSTGSTDSNVGSTGDDAGVSTSSTDDDAEVSTSSTDDDAGVSTSSTDATDSRPLPVRRGEAFCELLERLAGKDLPAAGGGATVVVTMTLADLEDRLRVAGIATLDTGTRISASEARRLACRHRLVPAVLGTDSVVLDLGASARFYNHRQRLALTVTQGGCTAEHCDVPASMCHAHHDQAWARGGPTDLALGRLLCGPHHRRIHDPAYDHELTPDNQVRFHRRT